MLAIIGIWTCSSAASISSPHFVFPRSLSMSLCVCVSEIKSEKTLLSNGPVFLSLSFLVFRVHHHHHLMLPICCCLIITSVVANLLSCGESSELFFAISCKISFLKARPHQFQSNDQEFFFLMIHTRRMKIDLSSSSS